jgi:uncharacterized membrane-anchored protein YjiN (DUF445 family)
MLGVVHDTLMRPDSMAAIRQNIRDELPTLLNFYRADAYLVKRIVASAGAFLEDVRSDPHHSFRSEFDHMLTDFAVRLDTEPGFADKIDGLKRDLLARPELGGVARTVWANIRSFIDKSAAGESQVLQHQLARMFVEAGAALAADREMRADINQGLVAVLRSFIAEHKSGVSSFIADQVKGWDMAQLIAVIEVNVGRDLQYIRFNGSLIGGLAGLALYTAEVLFRML